MKLSDYVASFLVAQGIRHVFVVSGGASLHLIHSVAKTPNIDFVCSQHEQAGAMAVDAYARVTGNMGAAIVTSGPGATNLLTGVCCAYYDSVPALYITGQVATFRMKGNTGVRQIGFQETDTINIFKSVTKYAVLVDDPQLIRFELEKACHIAKSGRPGPVLVDIPDNVQREEIDPDQLRAYVPEVMDPEPRNIDREAGQFVELLKESRRPVMVLGWGIRLAGAEREALALVEKLGIPVVLTWAVADLMRSDHSLRIGTFGTHGTRYANFAVQNADLVVAVGSRLDSKATGSPINTFAREAKKVVVDIDAAELGKFAKFGLYIDLLVEADALQFLRCANKKIETEGAGFEGWEAWIETIEEWKAKYPICPATYYEEEEEVNPYVFVKRLSEACKEGDCLFVDTGCAVAWMMQAFDFKTGQRLFHDCNNTAMGWALPASIAASFALDGKPVVCVPGDGSLMMNVQELATVVRHNLPIKIFLINNEGHSMIQQTQDQWLNSEYLASSVDGGLAFPHFDRVAEAFGLKTVRIDKNADLAWGIRQTLEEDGGVFCNVRIDSAHRVIPQVKFGRPNEDPDPLLAREEFLANMIIKPLSTT